MEIDATCSPAIKVNLTVMYSICHIATDNCMIPFQEISKDFIKQDRVLQNRLNILMDIGKPRNEGVLRHSPTSTLNSV